MTHKPRNSRQIAVYGGVFLAGLGYAWWLDNTRTGRFLAMKRHGMTLMIANGLSCLGLAFLLPLGAFRTVLHVTSLTGIGLVIRSLCHEMAQHEQFEKELAAWEIES